jgi:hypothetical protein
VPGFGPQDTQVVSQLAADKQQEEYKMKRIFIGGLCLLGVLAVGGIVIGDRFGEETNNPQWTIKGVE